MYLRLQQRKTDLVILCIINESTLPNNYPSAMNLGRVFRLIKRAMRDNFTLYEKATFDIVYRFIVTVIIIKRRKGKLYIALFFLHDCLFKITILICNNYTILKIYVNYKRLY